MTKLHAKCYGKKVHGWMYTDEITVSGQNVYTQILGT